MSLTAIYLPLADHSETAVLPEPVSAVPQNGGRLRFGTAVLASVLAGGGIWIGLAHFLKALF
jgi:hypothetical protein